MNAVIKRVCLSGATLVLLVNGPLFAQSALTPEQLTLRVERLTELSQRSEAKLSDVQEQLKTLSEDMGRMGRLIENRAVLDMIQQVDQISEDINLLRGEIEVQGNDVIEIKKRQRELYQDIDRRLRDLESRTVGQAPATQITVPQVSAPAQPAVSTSGSAALVPSLAPAAGAAAAASAPVTPTQAGEREAYQAAFDTLKEGRYKEAKVALQAFLDQYPNGSFSGNAQYWLGEAHYVTRNFEQGIVEFEKVLNGFPGSNKVPDAMLKLGYTFYELKQFPQSKAILQDLRTRFPDETASRLATKRLDRIRNEGH
ncbi:MAG: tol-pal system protein YbgF [Gammaproteobacteria bacterium]|jgi:tol-pal system protein YbgF|nr:tol-pal system protein YbgF [Gammaproteobacteria bacterium]